MPLICAVIGCNSKMGKDCGKQFFRIPPQIKCNPENKSRYDLMTERRRKWLANISRSDLSSDKVKYTRVCSDHFISGKVQKNLLVFFNITLL